MFPDVLLSPESRWGLVQLQAVEAGRGRSSRLWEGCLNHFLSEEFSDDMGNISGATNKQCGSNQTVLSLIWQKPERRERQIWKYFLRKNKMKCHQFNTKEMSLFVLSKCFSGITKINTRTFLLWEHLIYHHVRTNESFCEKWALGSNVMW